MKLPFKSKTIGRFLIILVLVMLAFASGTGHLDRLVNSIGLSRIHESNAEYLQESFDKSLKGFLVLSAIMSGVAVIEGSTVGVGFGLQIGDIVQPIYNYVDVAWRTALAGGVILLLMRIILQTLHAINNWFLFAVFSVSTILYVMNSFAIGKSKYHRMLKDLVLLTACLTVAFYIFVPVSIAGASYLSRKIARPLIEEAQAGFESIEKDFTVESINTRLFPDDDENQSLWSQLDFKTKLENSKQAVRRLGGWFNDITRDFAVWTIKLVAGYMFDCIIFPLAFFVVVYMVTKMLISTLLGVSRNQTMRDEFESIMKTYYGFGKKKIESEQ